MTKKADAEVAISAVLRQIDTDGDGYLSLREARSAISEAGMAVPRAVDHIWTKKSVDGLFLRLREKAITITEMISDAVDQVVALGDRPFLSGEAIDIWYSASGEGDISAMTATYPSEQSQCEETHLGQQPQLSWKVRPSSSLIIQRQCLFLNGEALTNQHDALAAESLSDFQSMSVGIGQGADSKCRVPSTNPADVRECSFGFQAAPEWTPKGYIGLVLSDEAIEVGDGPHELGEVPRYENYELSFRIVESNFDEYDVKTLVNVQGNGPYVAQGPNTLVVGALSGPVNNYPERPTAAAPATTISNLRFYGIHPLGATYKQSFCVEVYFCDSGTSDCSTSDAFPEYTVLRCSAGLRFNGAPVDVTARMEGQQGISFEWLYTSPVATTYRLYKYDPGSGPFVQPSTEKKSNAQRLLRELTFPVPKCGVVHTFVNFYDVPTAGAPGTNVAYAVVPANVDGVNDHNLVGSSELIVMWWGDVHILVTGKDDRGVNETTVKISRISEDGDLDPAYTNFTEKKTDVSGATVIPVRVQHAAWKDAIQNFRVTVEKKSLSGVDGQEIEHTHIQNTLETSVRHLSETTLRYDDTTQIDITGTIKHAGFDDHWFLPICPHAKNGHCFCPVVKGLSLKIKVGDTSSVVDIQDGAFTHRVDHGQIVELTLSYSEDSTANATPPPLCSGPDDPNCQFCESEDIVCSYPGGNVKLVFTVNGAMDFDFVDPRTRDFAAQVVHDVDNVKFVNGLPFVASVSRCGYMQPAWALKGEAQFRGLGAAADVVVGTLGAADVSNAKYYYPPGPRGVSLECDSTPRAQMVSANPNPSMLRGCRTKLRDMSAIATSRLPCAAISNTYVDELLVGQDQTIDLSETEVKFTLTSQLCLDEVKISAADPQPRGGNKLQSLLTHGGDREAEYDLAADEKLLLLSELPNPVPEGLYGTACTPQTGAIFREGDVVNLKFKLVERVPKCLNDGLYPWDSCNGYEDFDPLPAHSLPTDRQIKFRVADGVSGIDDSGEYAGNQTFTHQMTAGEPNPSAPFSHELSVEFTRAFGGAEILFLRHVLVLGSIPEEVPQVWTVATNPTLIFFVLRDPPGGGSFATLTEGSSISTSMAIDGSHTAELEDHLQLGGSSGFGMHLEAGLGFGVIAIKNAATFGYSFGGSYSQTPTDVTVSRATSRHFDVSISFSTGISTSSSPYLAGQPSDVIVGGGANLRFISAIEIFATAPVVVESQLVLDDVPSDVDISALRAVVATALVEKIDLVESTSDVLSFDVDADTFTTVFFSVRVPASTAPSAFAQALKDAVNDDLSGSLATAASNAGFAPAPTCPAGENTETIATKSDEPWLCLGGLTTQEFLPEQVSTWVMSVYEIEKTIERLGAALTDPNTKITSKDPNEPDPRSDIAKQIENWQTVLANYRATTIQDQAESIAKQLSGELDQFQTKFKEFLDKAKNDGQKNDAFKDFLVRGLNELDGVIEGTAPIRTAAIGAVAGMAGGPVGAAIGAAVGGAIGGTQAIAEAGAGNYLRGWSENRDESNVARATRGNCVSAATLADPSGDHRLCDVYDDISRNLTLKESLFGICDFAKACCKDDSGECSCRERTCADSGEECISDTDCDTGSCVLKQCSGGEPKCAPVDHFCKRDHYRDGQKIIGAFDALRDTTQFITFSGTNGLDFTWDIAQTRGAGFTSTHDANFADSTGLSIGGGFNVARRRLGSTTGDRGVPGYAYPSSGRVLAVSKKLLEVTPEALEERRRRLDMDDIEAHVTAVHLNQLKGLQMNQGIEAATSRIEEAVTKPESVYNMCGRRLDGTKMSNEERRRLGATGCLKYDGGTSTSFAVSLERTAGRDAEHSRSVSISLGDGNVQDSFAVKISQDAVYGTPIFTTMGGRSSCVGETGTTRRDSRVIIKEIKPLCAKSGEICDSASTCECKDLPLGEDAIFSVVLDNQSPWRGSVRYLLRAVNGASTAWNSGKYGSAVSCSEGDPGSLEIRAMGSSRPDLRDGDGIIFAPLNYGQHEVILKVSRDSHLAQQCFSYSNIALQLVSVCEDTDWHDVEDMYQYQTHMDPDTGTVSVVHPKFVGRPFNGTSCPRTDLNSADKPEASVAADKGTGRWCYSDLNLAVGCQASPATCWTACVDKITKLNDIEKASMADAAAQGCPISFIQQTDDKGEEFKCSPVDGPFELKAIAWEEETGQCRCQNSCDCTVKDLYSYDVTKNEGDDGYETRETTTHLLTEAGLEFPPTEDGEPLTCGLYTFKDDTKARSSDTSTATFDVSWTQTSVVGASPDAFVPRVHVITDELRNPTTQFSNISPFWSAWRAGAGAAAGNGAQITYQNSGDATALGNAAHITYKNFGDADVDAGVDITGYLAAISASCDNADALVIAIPFSRNNEDGTPSQSYDQTHDAINACLATRPELPIFSTNYDTYQNPNLYGFVGSENFAIGQHCARALLFTEDPSNLQNEPKANLDAVSGRGHELSAPVDQATDRCPGQICQVIWFHTARENAAFQSLVAGLRETLLEYEFDVQIISPPDEDIHLAIDTATGTVTDYVTSGNFWQEYASISNGFQVHLPDEEVFLTFLDEGSPMLICGDVIWAENAWQIGESPYRQGVTAVAKAAAAAGVVNSGGEWQAIKGNNEASTSSLATTGSTGHSTTNASSSSSTTRPCRPCVDNAGCAASEACVFEGGSGRRLRFGSIQQEGCCQAR